MKLVREVLRKNRSAIIVFAAVTAANAAVFCLYGIMAEPFFYAFAIGAFVLALIAAVDLIVEKKRARERKRALAAILTEWRSLPEAHSLSEEDCQSMIAALGTELERLTAEADAEKQDMLDYYTAWVHQIKTPIAVMRLKLSDGTPEDLALSAQLMRIEQYVDMVLRYARLNSDSNDLVIREFPLDELIREAVRKQAPLFVEKRLRLDYVKTDAVIVTDQKWFVCVLEQILSNAVKYTPSGTVTIREENGLLLISDTGVGIAAEDLPRIFEKGYTGNNGRLGQKSSGLGLYLAKKAADLIGVPLSAESSVGKGSTFTIDIREKYRMIRSI